MGIKWEAMLIIHNPIIVFLLILPPSHNPFRAEYFYKLYFSFNFEIFLALETDKVFSNYNSVLWGDYLSIVKGLGINTVFYSKLKTHLHHVFIIVVTVYNACLLTHLMRQVWQIRFSPFFWPSKLSPGWIQ